VENVAAAAKFGYQSDVIADLIKAFGFPYIALNPGASYRGLHDSLVNHNANDPPLLLCQHEKIAVQIAHGYAKVTGKPMVAIVHDVVGLLHSVMGIYYAYIDRAPVFVIGATGPVDEAKRRPWIDWIHTANVQGDVVRNFVKWDYQPGGIDGVVDSFARAYSIMMTEPQGPIYMCYDAWLQEAPLEEKIAIPSVEATVPTPIAAAPGELERVADRLVRADWPVLMAEYVGRVAHGFDDMVALAETIAAPVFDIEARLNFPTEHPLNLSLDRQTFRDADVILALDVRNWEDPTHAGDWQKRTKAQIYPSDCAWIDIGFSSIEISKWSTDYQRFPNVTQRVLADTALAIPALTELCRARIEREPALRAKVEERRARVGRRHHALREQWRQDARQDWDASPLTIPRLVWEVWEAIKDEDWVLTANTLNDWARKLWNFDRGYRHPGKYLGTGTQIGMSIGIALAHKGTGRLVVDFQPDGDLMFDVGALWTAARYEIPMLVVMHNNRAYWNDWDHQISVAAHRGRPVERAYIGQDITDPPPNFAGLARDFGWYAEGPIERPADVAAALRRAIAQVKAGKPALLDTITRRPKQQR
jgi:acetolactate synthase-1/2/3 large subunit